MTIVDNVVEWILAIPNPNRKAVRAQVQILANHYEAYITELGKIAADALKLAGPSDASCELVARWDKIARGEF